MIDHKPYRLEDELCFAIYSAQKNYNKFYSESLKKFKLTYSQYITLLVLWEEKKPMMIKELGERLGLDTGTLTPLLKRMEKDEWVTREHIREDGRRVYITLTTKAIENEKAVKDAIQSCFSYMDMTKEEYDMNVNRLKSISNRLATNNERLEEKFDRFPKL